MMTEEMRAPGDGQLLQSLTPDLQLRGDHVCLEPLLAEHEAGLVAAASSGELWKLPYTGVPSPKTMATMIEGAILNREQGSEFPFVVRSNTTGEIVGTTRYYFIEPKNRNLSIGYTWYAESVQRTAVNTECKYLLLEHAFETMKCISVQWHTDHRNKRSQAAIKRLGAKFEGVLRNHKIMPDGVVRHTHCFSMLDSEWPDSQKYLKSRLEHYRN